MRALGATTLAMALVCSAAAANAQSMPLYGEIGYTWLKISGKTFDNKPGQVRGIVGYTLMPYLAIEGMGAVGVTNDRGGFGADVDAKPDYQLGLYAKPKFDVTPQLELFARLGYAQSSMKWSEPFVSGKYRRSDWSYGAGVSYSFGRIYTGLDYMRYFNRGGVRLDGATLSVGYRF